MVKRLGDAVFESEERLDAKAVKNGEVWMSENRQGSRSS